MNPSFTLERGFFGPRVTLTGPWSPSIGDYLRQEGVLELYLNHARGWTGGNLDFLKTPPQLVAFSIVDLTIADISPIHHLSELRALEISTYCATAVNFAQFSQLERCVFFWREGSSSLFDSSTLRSLFLHRYSGQQSKPFGKLATLHELSVANGELCEIESLGHLEELRLLGLYNLRKLTSLEGIQLLRRLETLEINGCKQIRRIDELSSLVQLKRLHLNDDDKIESLAPLSNLIGLEEVLFYESTSVTDGDLFPVARLPRLQRISFQNRRHYSHKREDLPLVGHSAVGTTHA